MFKYRLKQLIAEKEMIEGCKFSVGEIASKIGVARSTLSKVANNTGHCSMETGVKICVYFGCKLDDLVYILPNQQNIK